MGLNGLTIEDELDMDIKKVGCFMTVNEAREKYDLKPLEGGDIPTNAILVQNKNNEAQMQQQSEEGSTENSSEEGEQEDNEDESSDINPFEEFSKNDSEKSENNSFIKAFDNFLKQEGIE